MRQGIDEADEVSINKRKNARRERNMQIVFKCLWGGETRAKERSSQLKRGRERLRENDRRGRRKGKERLRKTTPERLLAEPAAPSQPSSSSLPVCFAMVTRQGSQCSQLMCFSAAGASWVLMCLSLSPAQSMSTVLGCTNTWRGLRAREHRATLAESQGESLKEDHVTFIYSPENCSSSGALLSSRGGEEVLFVLISHVDHYYIDLKCLSHISDWVSRNVSYCTLLTCRKIANKRTQLIMFLKNPSQYLLVSHGI